VLILLGLKMRMKLEKHDSVMRQKKKGEKKGNPKNGGLRCFTKKRRGGNVKS